MSEEATLAEFAKEDESDGMRQKWRKVQLHEVASKRSDNVDPQVVELEKHIGLEHIDPNNPVPDWEPLDDLSSTKRRFKAGDILFAKLRPNLEKSAQPDFDGVASTDIFPIVAEADINSKWLLYRLSTKPAYDYARRTSAGTRMPRTSWDLFSNFEFDLPPLPAQRKITTVLYTVDRVIEKTEEIIEKYQSIISGLIQDIATTGINNKNLNEQKVPMLPERWEIPTHWKLDFLENISTLITDGAHQTPTYVENGIPFLKVEDIKKDTINWDSVARIPKQEHNNLIKRGNPTKGDVLLSKNGTIGITKVVDWNREFSHFVSLALIRPKQDIILPKYLATLLESQICMRQAKARSKTGTVTNLHLEEIEKLSIPVPPISEQTEILEKISSVQDCLKSEVRYRNILERLKRGLMQDLLSGKVRTTDTNIEVPEEIAQYG